MPQSHRRSEELYTRSSKVMVGGVSSPVRAFRSVGGTPVFFSRGSGSHIWDVDGNRYADYVCSWGALILGHSDPRVLSSVRKAMRKGTSFGAPTELELELANLICARVPSVERLRFVNSGTEATMSALRAARAFTRRNKVLKFEGCYHGHADPFLSEAGSGLATLDIPASAGVPDESVANTVTVPYNDSGGVEEAFRKWEGEIAAVIVEPVAGNMGVIPPGKEFLPGLRRICSNEGSVLIFDEVITGFRVSPGGAQELYGVKPDLTTMGKVIGGGFPVGAYGGSKQIMKLVAPEGPVYQAGTLSGNPVAMSAGIRTLGLLGAREYRRLDEGGRELEAGLSEAASSAQVSFSTNRVGSMVGVFFTPEGVANFEEAKKGDRESYADFFWGMLKRGSYLPPSAFETLFTSTAHTSDDTSKTAEAARQTFKSWGRTHG